jgi:hypothetical protein
MPYSLNGQSAQISQEPFVRDNKHFVPLEEVVRALGGTTTWDNNSKTASATIGRWTANVRMDDPNVDVSGTPVRLSAAPFVENDTMYVPWDFFREAYGYDVSMQGETLDVRLPKAA